MAHSCLEDLFLWRVLIVIFIITSHLASLSFVVGEADVSFGCRAVPELSWRLNHMDYLAVGRDEGD